MFRKGGSAGEGITSGLAPRQGYQGTGNAPFGNQSTVTPNPTPLQTALGTASVLSGIFGGGNRQTQQAVDRTLGQ